MCTFEYGKYKLNFRNNFFLYKKSGGEKEAEKEGDANRTMTRDRLGGKSLGRHVLPSGGSFKQVLSNPQEVATLKRRYTETNMRGSISS